jgi:hypothetical protein
MKALTVRHPWALALALGIKPVENRSRPLGRNAIGQRVAIHASLAVPEDALDVVVALGDRGVWPATSTDKVRLAMGRTNGRVLAIATLARVIEHGDGDPLNASDWRSATDRFGLVFTDVVRLVEPVACRGMLGLWTLPPDVQRAVDEQLAIVAAARVEAARNEVEVPRG